MGAVDTQRRRFDLRTVRPTGVMCDPVCGCVGGWVGVKQMQGWFDEVASGLYV